MDLKDYKPIDYSKWNFLGDGYNILDSLSSIERTLWNEALPYQDKREDRGHAETVVYFALKSLSFFPNANREIVIPAAIFHDTGYAFLVPEEKGLLDQMIRKGGDPGLKQYNPIIRQRHQEKGVEFAGQKLAELVPLLDYKKVEHILEIISQHDTRQGFFSLEDKLARDADKLWRVVFKSVLMNAEKLGRTIEDFKNEDAADIHKKGFYGTRKMYEIAKIELENTLKHAEKKKQGIKMLVERYWDSLK